MNLYLCEERRDADAFATALGAPFLGMHAFHGIDLCVSWFYGEPSNPVAFHPAQPISPQLLGLKALLGEVHEVVLVDIRLISKRNIMSVLDLLGYVGVVNTYTSSAHENTQHRHIDHGMLHTITKELRRLVADDLFADKALRLLRREILTGVFRTLLQASWQFGAVSEFNAVHMHVLLKHWERLFISEQEIFTRLDQVIWLADTCGLRHVATLARCVQCVMHHSPLPASMSHAHAWLLCAQAFDETRLRGNPEALARIVINRLSILDQERQIEQA